VKTRAWLVVGALVAAAVIVWIAARPDRDSEKSSDTPSDHDATAQPVREAPDRPIVSGSTPASEGSGAEAGAGAGSSAIDPDDPLAHYPVNLDDLRARLPNNRYWQLGVPTRDPAVARARAERARRDNELFGRVQTGEASEPEIRAYYDERRRVSEDFLQLSMLALAEKGDQLPERDRGMFELSVTLHRARLKQIDRDLADALARRRGRGR
jgi:hypothetical protein